MCKKSSQRNCYDWHVVVNAWEMWNSLVREHDLSAVSEGDLPRG